ncbi:hypothetical protein AMTR_s00045p00160070 [Amborella trichopoda]|uniref:Protein kinase domain-containing protein n=1 Tax=Amborella trichopoda TaxID=13333 RepID=W1P557_AMBTC|nr:hypothetical protein AMTR_s00045p00160070 [Amborella trichopoda]
MEWSQIKAYGLCLSPAICISRSDSAYYLIILSWAAVFAEAELSHHKSGVILGAPLEAPPKYHSGTPHVGSDLPLPANIPHNTFPPFHRRHRRHFKPDISFPPALVPSQPPGYGSLTTSSHPPSTYSYLSKPSMRSNPQSAAPSSGLLSPPSDGLVPKSSNFGSIASGLAPPPLSPHVSGCCGSDMMQRRDNETCDCVYPIRLELLLSNVSLNSNLSSIQEDFASQLGLQVSQFELIYFYIVGLTGLNMSMDIIPLTGVSFSSNEAYRINYTLTTHRVELNHSLVGDYEVLNFTWFKPPAPAPETAAPPVMSPQAATPISAGVSYSSSKRVKHPSLVLLIGIGSGILIIFIVSVVVICSCTSGQRKKEAPPIQTAKQKTADAVSNDGSLPHPTSTRVFAYEELKEATNNFEPASMLGEGGFGRVFKGVLSDGTAVAIKKLSSGGHQGDKEFLVEVEMLSRLHHRNLVKLVGYYSSRDSSQHLLCYELVPNGSLESWLHGPVGANRPLDWDTRMKIALDAARGLAYLHEDSQPCVIHRDFKASNILLEHNFHAKVADFGLAKQAPEGRGNYLSTRVMGTFGYVAPEYAMTGHLLVKSDVYSYGVVLLELLTGRRPVDMTQPSGQENLVTGARPILRDKDRLEQLADPRLSGKYPKEDFMRVCTIAAACVAPEANQRPTMGEVVQSLKMVQRVTEYQDTLTTSNRPNIRQSSTTYESDGTSSMFSSGPFSGLSAFDNDAISRNAVFSEDLQEGR